MSEAKKLFGFKAVGSSNARIFVCAGDKRHYVNNQHDIRNLVQIK